MKKLYLLLFFCTNASLLFSQGTDAVFLKETIVKGEFKGNIFATSQVKLRVNEKILRFKKNKIDSISYNNKMYSIHKNWLAPSVLERIGSANAGVYKMNDRIMILKRREKSYFPISKRYYNKVLSVLSGTEVKDKITQEQFILALNKEKSSRSEINDRLDSALRVRKEVTLRLSFMTPEVGLEFKIEPSISFYSGFSMNSFGGIAEPTDAYFNFDQMNELRFYFSQEKRIEKGKNSYNYSGYYFAPAFMQAFDAGFSPKYSSGVFIGWQDNGLFSKTFSAAKIGGFYNKEYEYVFLLFTYSIGLAF